jgi:hypothetical protein
MGPAAAPAARGRLALVINFLLFGLRMGLMQLVIRCLVQFRMVPLELEQHAETAAAIAQMVIEMSISFTR